GRPAGESPPGRADPRRGRGARGAAGEGRVGLSLLSHHARRRRGREGHPRGAQAGRRARARRRADHRHEGERLAVRFLICIKQVPDSTTRVKVAPDGRAIVTEGITWSISPYDEYAIELALERKDADPTTIVAVVTVGPARSRDALRQALAMGCDEASLVTAEAAAPLAVARALAKVVEETKPDLVLCGKQASDDD